MIRLVHKDAGTDTNQALVERAKSGDRGAFDELYRRHVDLVWWRLGRLLGPDPEREDLLQQIFLEVFRDLWRFRGEASLPHVPVPGGGQHLLRSPEARGRRPRPVSAADLDGLIDGDRSPEARAVERQRLALTLSLLDRIKPKKRMAFLLRVVEGLSLEEIAEIVDARPAAVAQRVRHAHRELEGMLDKRKGDDR